MVRSAIHPGEILADELQELNISAAELARLLHVPTNRITQILKGKRAITADTALRLGQWFGTGPELWLNLQKSYELRLTQQEIGEEIQRLIQPRIGQGQRSNQI
jgi:addiction module HigA family antidote